MVLYSIVLVSVIIMSVDAQSIVILSVCKESVITLSVKILITMLLLKFNMLFPSVTLLLHSSVTMLLLLTT
jgi:hypothetical protein